MNLRAAFRLLRPHQYTKNLLVFSAPGAAGRLDEADTFALTVAAFALFCVVSSLGYIANDLTDIEADRRHPKKQNRPLASGKVSPAEARRIMVFLAIIAIATAPMLGWPFACVLGAYAGLSLFYSRTLKRIPWLELVAVAAGFMLRALAGGIAADTDISVWFVSVVTAGALLLITGKRLGELLTIGADAGSRKVLASYPPRSLRWLASAAALASAGSYAAWAATEATNQAADGIGSTLLQLTAVPFTIAIARFLSLAWTGRGETPEMLVLKDPIVVLSGFVWVTLYATGLYL